MQAFSSALHLVLHSAVTELKFLITFEQGALCFHFALSHEIIKGTKPTGIHGRRGEPFPTEGGQQKGKKTSPMGVHFECDPENGQGLDR